MSDLPEVKIYKVRKELQWFDAELVRAHLNVCPRDAEVISRLRASLKTHYERLTGEVFVEDLRVLGNLMDLTLNPLGL